MSGSRRHVGFFAAAVASLIACACVTIVLVSYIDTRLKHDAEGQVMTFTQQAAENVGYHMAALQNAFAAFTVQSDDPAEIVPSLKALEGRFSLAHVAFATPSGQGLYSDGTPFSVADLPQEETALSAGAWSHSPTFVNDEGVKACLVQRPLTLDGERVGALYAQVPLDALSPSFEQKMLDGEGSFMLFRGDTGEIVSWPDEGAEGAEAALDGTKTFYEYLDEVAAPTRMNAVDATLNAEDFLHVGVEDVRRIVSEREMGMVTGDIGGRQSYVCIAPIGWGSWFACNIVPVASVRSEASMMSTMFQILFFFCAVCLVLAMAVAFTSYRKRLREKNLEMKTHLFDALTESLDIAVNLYSPADNLTTPIVAKTRAIMGYPLWDLLNDERKRDAISLSEEGRALLDHVREGAPGQFERREFSLCGVKAGKKRWVSCTLRPLVYDDKSQVLVVMRDVTTEKEMQLSMKDAMDAAESANQAKSLFLSRMSHEIRTPMNVVLGMLNIAQRNVGNVEKTRSSLLKMEAASHHLLSIINDVLDISKIESGKMALSNELFRLSEVIGYLQEIVRSQCAEKSQTYAFKWDDVENCDEVYVGDSARLRQLLVNLLTNAIKYTPEQGHVELSVSLAPSPLAASRTVTFVVADNGIGMTQDFQERMFEPFAMEGRSASPGTGLGMSIVQNIVSLMHGAIHVRSQVGEGTTFTVVLDLRVAARRGDFYEGPRGVTLPVACAGGGTGDGVPSVASGDAAGGTASGDAAGGAAGGAAAPGGEPCGGQERAADGAVGSRPLAGLRILLAEDSDLNAEIAQELLADEGAVTDWAPDGGVACRMFETAAPGTYDAVLMDVQMPNVDGLEATRCIRALPRPDAADVPIIAMSANAFDEDVRASLESGMNAHLSKPIDINKVVATLLDHVNRTQRDKAE